jgi:hypothetical protein
MEFYIKVGFSDLVFIYIYIRDDFLYQIEEGKKERFDFL